MFNVRMSEEMSRIFWSGTFYGLDKAKVLSEDLENQTNFNGWWQFKFTPFTDDGLKPKSRHQLW